MPMTEEKLKSMICQGTTTKPEQLRILFLGEHVALIGTSGRFWSDNGGRHYGSASINLYYLKRGYNISRNFSETKELHEGRYSQKRLAELIEQAKKAEADEPAFLEAKKKEEEEEEKSYALSHHYCKERMRHIRSEINAEKIKEDAPRQVFGLGNGKIYGSMEITFKNGIRVNLDVYPEETILTGIFLPKFGADKIVSAMKVLSAVSFK